MALLTFVYSFPKVPIMLVTARHFVLKCHRTIQKVFLTRRRWPRLSYDLEMTFTIYTFSDVLHKDVIN